MILVVLIIRIVMFKVFETMAKKGLETMRKEREAIALTEKGCCCTVS